MALTRPKIGQFNTTITSLTDPITVLNGGATLANVDVGFLMNRANGLVSNVALYWNESGNTFVTAFTSNSGVTDSNIAVTNYANIITGALTVVGRANINGNLNVSGTITAAYVQNGATSSYATQRVLQYNETTGAVTYSNYLDATRVYITGYGSEVHVSPVALDDTGNGTIGDPVKTIARAQVLAAAAFETTGVGERKTIVLHPGSYTEDVTISTQYTVLTTHELVGKNTTLTGNLTITKGCTIEGLKMTNLVISANSSVGSVDIIGCTVSTATTKTSSAYTVFRGCDLSSSTLSITGTGTTVMVGGNYGNVTVNNAAAGVLVKAVVSMGPVTLTAGTLQISDTLVYAATNTANAITQSAGSVLTLNNSQTLIPDLSNVARNSFGGFYSILHSVYDKANSTFGGTSLAAISYSQVISTDSINVTSTTASTSNITGALVVKGGAGVAGNLYIGGNITVTGNILPSANVTYDIGSPTQRFRSLYLSGNTIDLAGATIKTDAVSGAVVIIPIPTVQVPNPTAIVVSPAGTISAIQTQSGTVASANIAAVANAAAAAALTTFANVQTTGNLEVQGNLSVAGTVTFTNSVVQTQTELVLGTEIVGGNLIANSATVSTNTSTGALVVVGGAGISGNLNVGGNISATNIFQDRGNDMNDWNTLTVMGVYLINRDSWTGTSNTPLNTLNFTGQLEVINTGNVSITQNYRPYDNATGPNVFWTRSKYSASAWTTWVKIINGSEVMDGGSF